MATTDKRGTREDFKILPTSGWSNTFTLLDSAGSAVDITNYTFTLTTSDDEGAWDYERSIASTTKTYSGTITDAANGKVSMTIPASDFNKKWGEQINYGIQKTVSGTDSEAFWGVLQCEQLR